MENKPINIIIEDLVEQSRSSIWLGEKLGISDSTISHWFKNKMQNTIDKLPPSAKLLNVDIWDLLSSTKKKTS